MYLRRCGSVREAVRHICLCDVNTIVQLASSTALGLTLQEKRLFGTFTSRVTKASNIGGPKDRHIWELLNSLTHFTLTGFT